MKTLFFLFFVTLYLPVLSAQDTIPKGANTIVISGTFQQSDMFNKVSDILFENGIAISNSDKELGQITSGPKAFKHGNIFFIILVKDDKVTIRGQWAWNQTIALNGASTNPNELSEVSFSGQRGSPKRSAWDAFYKVAQQIPGKKAYLGK